MKKRVLAGLFGGFKAGFGFFRRRLSIAHCTKSARSLLVHLRTRRNTIKCQIQDFAGSDDGDNVIDVFKDSKKDISLRFWTLFI